MQGKRVQTKTDGLLADILYRRTWKRVAAVLSCFVVIGTVSALTLPGITMAQPLCGVAEHLHSTDCYLPPEPASQLCLTGDTAIHAHSEGCYDGSGEMTCGMADYVLHTHDDVCYDDAGDLICTLPEVVPHIHDDDCWYTPEIVVDPGHDHGTGCYEWLDSASPSCGMNEGRGHEHDERCYEEVERLACRQDGDPEHRHDGSCYTTRRSLVCSENEAPAHTHDDSCYRKVRGELTCTKEEEPPVTQPGEPELVCGFPEGVDIQDAHDHTDSCYDESGAQVCPLLAVAEHQHTGECFQIYEPQLICGLEEHTHTDACAELPPLTEADMVVVEELIAAIDTLPTTDEVSARMEELMEEGDEDAINSYYMELTSSAQLIFVQYQGMTPQIQAAITNADRLLALEPLWSAMPLAIINSFPITTVNTFNWTYHHSVIYYNSNGRTIGEAYNYWYMVIAETDGTNYFVKRIYTNDGSNKSNVSITKDQVAIVFYPGYVGGTVNVNVGDRVTFSNNNWKTNNSLAYSAGGRLTVTFSEGLPTPAGTQKAQKDNTSQLEIVPSADTSNFIHVNLYDYGDKINDLHDSDSKYPGFQQEYGTRSINEGDTSLQSGEYNFGNNITDNYDAGKNNLTNKGGDINRVINSANRPISGALLGTLGSDGYPALADGTSLAYLFSNNASTSTTKMNDKNINGLFQYDPATGSYFYNSRESHAQFDAATDTFTVYKQIITPNFMMYPFGNFMPFHDIVHLSKRSSEIDADYLAEISQSALFKYTHEGQEGYLRGEYLTLSDQLEYFNSAMDSMHGTGWTAYDAANDYFKLAVPPAPATAGGPPPAPPSFDSTFKFGPYDLPLFDNAYTIDYDEPSNFYFGMDMSMDLMQPKDGLTGPDGQQKMYFYFTGDDDVWVYIDEKLVLDLSGIHRHVGGAIDFEMGTVLYFELDPAIGDVGTTVEQSYQRAYFEDIFKDTNVKLKNTGKTRVNGSTAYTFEDYSEHTFKFFYMERGSGSSICRMNFNFPLLRQNNIIVKKELTVSDPNAALIGDPDYYFQIMDADPIAGDTQTTPYYSDRLLIGADVEYDVYDQYSNYIETRKTDANGMFTLKAGQSASFGAMENAGNYYVRELFPEGVLNTLKQYGEVSVNGTAVKQNSYTGKEIGSEKFSGVNGPIQDIGDGHTTFAFTNHLTTSELGALAIEKVLTDYDPLARAVPTFDFEVTLDGQPLPVGTPYTVYNAAAYNAATTPEQIEAAKVANTPDRTVQNAGVVTIGPGEKAVIGNIIAGSDFTVQETAYSGKAYTVLYSGVYPGTTTNLPTGSNAEGEFIYGTIPAGTVPVAAVITNMEKGATVTIDGKKIVPNYDQSQGGFTFNFQLTQVTDAAGAAAVENGTQQTTSVQYPGDDSFQFTLSYVANEVTDGQLFYYKITESSGTSPLITYDPTAYVVEIQVSKGTDGSISAKMNNLYIGGTAQNPMAERLDFTNTLLTSLTIGKELTGVPVDDRTFDFTVELTNPASAPDTVGTPVTGTFKAKLNGADAADVTFDAEGKANITLTSGDRLTILGLPQNVGWTITELNTEGYAVSYTVDGGTVITGSSGTGTVASLNGSTVVFTNFAAYVLPTTGGAGTFPYIFSGMALMLFACLLLYKERRCQRKEAR